MNELGVQKEVRTQIMSPFWLRRVNYGSQYLRLVRLLLSNICIPDKNIGFVGNKRLSLFSMPPGQNEVMWHSKSAGVYPRLVSDASCSLTNRQWLQVLSWGWPLSRPKTTGLVTSLRTGSSANPSGVGCEGTVVRRPH